MGIFYSPFLFFTDPVLRAPTIGCILMCLAASLPGVFVFLRKKSLLGETLSHASYPGVIVGILFAALFSVEPDESVAISSFVLVGAFSSACLGLWAVYFLEKKIKVSDDAALCFVLASFFGIGLTLASRVQFTHTSLYKQMLTYLYGQAATMTDIHIYIYGSLALFMTLIIFIFFKELKIISLDENYAKSLGIPVRLIDTLLFTLIVLAVVVGIRSVGIVLMSGMLIAPAVTARQFTHRLSIMLILAAFFAMVSGFLGVYISETGSHYLSTIYPQSRLSLPTGPMIVLVATFFCALALLFSPERGILMRYWKFFLFQRRCLGENILKNMWHLGPDSIQNFHSVTKEQNASKWYLKTILWRLRKNGWVIKAPHKHWRLTKDGALYAARIVRLHRLWELYLADHLGIGVERVHRNAEEMEHIITPEIEKRLTALLNNPTQDPHKQPIPPYDEGIIPNEK